jgi:hypothetical protein
VYQLRTPILPEHFPHFYINVKYKCWRGRRLICEKEGHVHYRTITSTAGNHAELKRLTRRAMRGLAVFRQTEEHLTWQLWGMHTMTPRVQAVVEGLARPAEFQHVCICHGRPKPAVVGIQLDANCFYENADAARGCTRAKIMSVRVSKREGTSFATVSADGKSGRLGRTSRGASGKRARDSIHIDHCTTILDGCRRDNRFRVGQEVIVIRQNSWPMGGEESAEAVGCDAHQDEFELHIEEKKQRDAGWWFPPFELKQLVGGIRAIDNLFLVSYVFCEETLEQGGSRVYPADFGMTKETCGPQQQFLMGQVPLCPVSGSVTMVPTSHNAEYARFQVQSQVLTRVPPYLGALVTPLAYMRQFLQGALARYAQICPRDSTLAIPAFLDMYWELRRLGYTHRSVESVLRGLKPRRTTPMIRIMRSALRSHRRTAVLCETLEPL